jgi:hypothetical protein
MIDDFENALGVALINSAARVKILHKALLEERTARGEAAAEIERLCARVAELRQHLSDAVSVANSAMIDANRCADRTKKKWDRDAELEVFHAALEATS